MILPDANLLLYAHDTASPFHGRAKVWWENCLSGSEPVGLCTVVLFAFVRIGTSRRAFLRPLTIGEAAQYVREWLERAITHVVATETDDVVRALELLEAAGSGGNLTTDAQLAALAIRHRATVHTADTDFQRFPEVKWVNPIV